MGMREEELRHLLNSKYATLTSLEHWTLIRSQLKTEVTRDQKEQVETRLDQTSQDSVRYGRVVFIM